MDPMDICNEVVKKPKKKSLPNALKRRKSCSKPVTPKPGSRKPSSKKNMSIITRRVVTKTKNSTRTRKTKRTIRTGAQKIVTETLETNMATRPLGREGKILLKNKRFYAWEDDDYVIKTLQERGWTYLGEPVKDGRENYPSSLYTAVGNNEILMGDVLFWADDDDSKVLKGHSHNHLISSLPNADKALTKIFQQTMFHEYDWFPKCFTLPQEKQKLLDFMAVTPESYWILKPKDSYGGFGMSVYKANSPAFQENVLQRKMPFVMQRYMENPYLLAGLYKFHFRAYMVVTNVKNPFRAYLWKNCQLQFCTHEFDLSQIESNFNKYSHITNYKVNNEKKNKVYVCQDKPGIGTGTEWGVAKFFEYMKVNEPRFSPDQFWRELEAIARVVSKKLTTNKYVSKAFNTTARTANHFEIYGLDILMNDKCQLSMTEANTQPGLDYTDPTLPDGSFQPEVIAANDITKGIINDTITLLELDGKKDMFSEFIPLH